LLRCQRLSIPEQCTRDTFIYGTVNKGVVHSFLANRSVGRENKKGFRGEGRKHAPYRSFPIQLMHVVVVFSSLPLPTELSFCGETRQILRKSAAACAAAPGRRVAREKWSRDGEASRVGSRITQGEEGVSRIWLRVHVAIC